MNYNDIIRIMNEKLIVFKRNNPHYDYRSLVWYVSNNILEELKGSMQYLMMPDTSKNEFMCCGFIIRQDLTFDDDTIKLYMEV